MFVVFKPIPSKLLNTAFSPLPPAAVVMVVSLASGSPTGSSRPLPSSDTPFKGGFGSAYDCIVVSVFLRVPTAW